MNDEGGLNLGKIVGVIRRQIHIVVMVSVLVGAAGFLKAWLEPPLFRSRFELLTEPVSLETKVISSTNSETLSSREDLLSVEADELKLKILKSPKILLPVVKKLQKKYENIDYTSLERDLELKTVLQASEAGNILEVTYHNNNENQVRDVLDEIAKTYLNYSLETRQSDINQGILFLDRQLPVLRKEVDLLQQKLQRLRQQNNLIDPIVQAELLSAQLDAFKQEQQTVQVDLTEALLLDNSQQLENKSNEDGQISASILETENYKNLKEQLLLIDVELAKQSAIWTENASHVQLLQEQRQNLISLLKRETQQLGEEVQISASQRILKLRFRDQALSKAINGLESKIKLLSATTRQYVDLQRDLEIATKNLTEFITKREALKIDAAQQQIPWEMLTPPNDPESMSSGIKRNLALGTILGLLLGIACAVGLDNLGNLVHTPEEIQEIIQKPILGIIPFNKKIENFDANNIFNDLYREVVNRVKPRKNNLLKVSLDSVFTEAFNSFYANLCLLTPDAPIRSLVVSSAWVGEGKSTIALYLGLAAAGLGRRVLLVDTNLRNPKLHDQVGATNVLGLTDLIYRNNLDPQSIIQPSWKDENLFVLTCGQLPPDPIRILGSEKMTNLMKKLQGFFDLVIYDAPYIVGLADTLLLAKQTDGVVLVCALEQIQRSELEDAKEQIALSNTQLWGVVVNKSHSVSIRNKLKVQKEYQEALCYE